MNSGCSAQFNRLSLMFICSTDYFSNIFFSFDFFSNTKLGIEASFSQVKTNPNPSYEIAMRIYPIILHKGTDAFIQIFKIFGF